MNVAKHDIVKKRVINEIKNKEALLLQTYNNLKKIKDENQLYNSILQDYQKHYDYILDEKQKQYNALETIFEYLENLIDNTDILKEKGEILKNDQKNILEKLLSIRKEIQEIQENNKIN